MAVQKSKKSRSRSKMRRAHVRLKQAETSVDPFTGEVHRRHHISAQGYYKGKQVLLTQTQDSDSEE